MVPRPRDLPRLARQVAVFVAGAALFAVGVALIVLPGPAFVVLPAALGVWSLEFDWAGRLLSRLRQGMLRLRPRA